MTDQVLLCDLSLAPRIGLALSSPGSRPRHVGHFHGESRQDFEAALDRTLEGVDRTSLIGAAVSARGWERNGELHMKGVGFAIDRDYIRGLLGIQRVNFVNNFVARALAVPKLRRGERSQLVGGEVVDDHAIAVLGPHHGLGLASLVSDGAGGWTALHGEGGHSDLPARDEREWRIIQAIRDRNGYVSRESGMSVAGLADIWCALHTLAGETPRPLSTAQIIAAARAGEPRAVEAVDTMTGWLGAMASDVALIIGASGVYLTGALLDMLGDLFKADIFARRYLGKGPLEPYVSRIPVFRTEAENMELIGLATLYD